MGPGNGAAETGIERKKPTFSQEFASASSTFLEHGLSDGYSHALEVAWRYEPGLPQAAEELTSLFEDAMLHKPQCRFQFPCSPI